MSRYSENEKIEMIQNGIQKIAPDKIFTKITMNTSLTKDVVLNSLEIVDLLIEIQDVVSQKYPQSKEASMDNLLAYLFQESDDLLVSSLCKFIEEI